MTQPTLYFPQHQDAILSCIINSDYPTARKDMDIWLYKIDQRIAHIAENLLSNLRGYDPGLPTLQKRTHSYICLSEPSYKLFTKILSETLKVRIESARITSEVGYNSNHIDGELFMKQKNYQYDITYAWDSDNPYICKGLTIGQTAQAQPAAEKPKFAFSLKDHLRKYYTNAKNSDDPISFSFGALRLYAHREMLMLHSCEQLIKDSNSKPPIYTYEIYSAILEFMYIGNLPEFNCYDTLVTFAEAVRRYKVMPLIEWTKQALAEYETRFTNPAADFHGSVRFALSTKNTDVLDACLDLANKEEKYFTTLMDAVNKPEHAQLISERPTLVNYPKVAIAVLQKMSKLAAMPKEAPKMMEQPETTM